MFISMGDVEREPDVLLGYGAAKAVPKRLMVQSDRDAKRADLAIVKDGD